MTLDGLFLELDIFQKSGRFIGPQGWDKQVLVWPGTFWTSRQAGSPGAFAWR